MRVLPVLLSRARAAPGSLNAFSDNFAGSALDTSKWVVMNAGNPTITSGSPATINFTAHGFPNNTRVVFTSNSDVMPTGLVLGTTYYTRNVSANAFELSATSGGTSINTTVGPEAGTHRLTTFGYLGVGVASLAVNNRLEITTQNLVAGVNYGGVISLNSYDLTANAAYIKFNNTTSGSTVQQRLVLYADINNNLEYYNDGSNGLRTYKVIAGSETVVSSSSSFAWPGPTWVRIRETGGNIEWAHAPDSGLKPGPWVTQGSMATPFAVTSVTVAINAGSFSTPAGGLQTFGGFNTRALS